MRRTPDDSITLKFVNIFIKVLGDMSWNTNIIKSQIFNKTNDHKLLVAYQFITIVLKLNLVPGLYII